MNHILTLNMTLDYGDEFHVINVEVYFDGEFTVEYNGEDYYLTPEQRDDYYRLTDVDVMDLQVHELVELDSNLMEFFKGVQKLTPIGE